MPADNLPNAERLLEPAAFAADRRPEDILVQVTDAAAFASAHLPGAVLVEPRELVCGIPPATGKVPPQEQIAALLGSIGYRPDARFVVYDDEGGGWAGRFIWTLDLVGHGRWAYLDGGLHAWLAAGLPLEAGPPPPRVDVAADLVFVPGPRATLEDVLAVLEDPGCIVWDARSEAEHRGLRSGSARAGRIPGSVHLDWLDLQDPTRALRLRADLPDLLAEHGIRRDKRVITHCQTHHRSGLSYLVARLLDYPAIAAYDGSWSEWGNRDDTPIAAGA